MQGQSFKTYYKLNRVDYCKKCSEEAIAIELDWIIWQSQKSKNDGTFKCILRFMYRYKQ